MRRPCILFKFRVFWNDPIDGKVAKHTWAQSGIQARNNVRQRCFGNKTDDQIAVTLEVELVKGVTPKPDFS